MWYARSHKVTSVTLVVVLWSVAFVWSAPVHIYVSPTGNDSNDGFSASHPVKTLQHVVDMLGLHGVRNDTVFVELMQGYHDLSSTLYLRSTNGTVVFRAYHLAYNHFMSQIDTSSGDKNIKLSQGLSGSGGARGGKHIDSSQFHAVHDANVLQRLPPAARTNILELDLTAAGITDLGVMRTYGRFIPTPVAPLEISINGKPLRLAEWPNQDFINIESVPGGKNGQTLTYESGDRDVEWAKETEPWAYGYWYMSFDDSSQPVSSIDPHTRTITLKNHTTIGLRVGHYDSSDPYKTKSLEQGGYFRGEYYVDRSSKKLYLLPNTPHHTLTSSDTVYASMIDECIIIEGNAQDVHFQDFTLESCRHHGVLLKDARNVTIKNLDIKNTGGDRANLTSSQNVISDNHIWQHSRTGAFPNHGVLIDGVKATVTHNHLHHGQYTGILWQGNDHVMEYNHVHHMCMVGTDCGALHSLRDWTYRGNIIRHNHIHHTQRLMPGSNVRGIMMDDEYSSALIENNVLYTNDVHANIAGGRDNVIRYNVMYNARRASVQVDGRGLKTGHGHNLRKLLQESPYRTPSWQARYPKLYNILNGRPEEPEGNQIYSNIFYNNNHHAETIHINNITYLNRPEFFDIHDNFQTHQPPLDSNFRLQCDSAPWAVQNLFPAPPTLAEVGPQKPTGPHYLRVRRPIPTHPLAKVVDCYP